MLRKAVRALLTMALIIVLLGVSLLLVSAFERTWARNKSINILNRNFERFEEIANSQVNKSAIFFGARSYTVPEDLQALGIEKIFTSERVVYFEFEKVIMGVTLYGVLMTADTSSIDAWYRLEHIKDNWYYFRYAP